MDAPTDKNSSNLAIERKRCSFKAEELTYLLDGSKARTTRRRQLQHLVYSDPDFDSKDVRFMERSERYSEALRKAVLCVQKMNRLEIDDAEGQYLYKTFALGREQNPLGLHYVMFMPSLMGQATDEQKDKWLTLAENYEIIGTYAQTEIGHGTFLRGLETTATYDASTQEFVIHSPTLTSTKFWPGTLGKTANFAVVLAQFFTSGKRHGIHQFIVQLRSLHDHRPMPGVTVGDIGPKNAYESMDNGFLRFDHVRIPRDQMLMRNSQVKADGTYVSVPKGGEKLTYGTMLFVRSVLVWDTARELGRAATIAIYSAVRRQSEMIAGAGESIVLDYQTQQFRLFPLLAATYIYIITGLEMRQMYFTAMGEIMTGNLGVLPELHGLSSGIKALVTNHCASGVEQCRMACGGQGFSQSSGFSMLYGSVAPACTYEGENTVMYLQTARYLLKCYKAARLDTVLAGSVEYLSEPPSSRSTITRDHSVLTLLDAFKHRAQRMVMDCGKKLETLTTNGMNEALARNAISVELVQAAQVHCQYFVLKTYLEFVSAHSDISAALKRVLELLGALYALHNIGEKSGDFLQDEYMTPAQVEFCRESLLEVLNLLRPEAVTLVDAFDFPDRDLGSVLGCYDGHVYQRLYDWALNSPLNEDDVHPSYEKYLKPLMQRNKSKL